MSDLDWDSVLGDVAEEEKENPGGGGGDFETIPKGPYEVVVQEADKQTAQSSGNDMIKVRVQITGGPYANRVLFSYIVFTTGNPKGMRVTLDKLAAFGVTREVIAASKPSIPQIAEMLVGRKAIATVGIQEKGEYKGNNEVKGFKPLTDGAQAPVVAGATAKPAGVPNIPQPTETSATPNIPMPEVPVGPPADASDPFAG